MLGAIYARYSEGPHQTDQSIEGQVSDCKAYAEAHDIQIVEIYADRHVSGKSLARRTEFLRMLNDAEAHRFECVIVWKIDRFGRDRQDIALSKMKLKKAGVLLKYAQESVPDGPEGIILESVLEGLAEYYSADLRQKVMRGMKESAKKGLYCGAKLPIGYKVDETRHIVIDEEKAVAVRELFRMYIDDASMKELAAMLYEHGIKGKQGQPVSQSVIHRMLRNDRYIGHFESMGIEIPVEPIIGQETFDRAAAHFRPSRNNAAGRAKVHYLLSCKCFCGYCDAVLNGESGTGKGGKIYHYYKCGGRKRGGKCELKPINQEHLENCVIDATVEDMLTDEMICRIAKRVIEIQDEQDKQDPAAGYRKMLADNKKRRKNIMNAIEEGAATKAMIERLAELEDDAFELEAEIAHAEIKKPHLTIEAVELWLKSFRGGDKNDATFRQRLVDTFIDHIDVRNGEALIYYNIMGSDRERGVRVQDRYWTLRNRTRTLKPFIADGYIILPIAV